MPGEGARAGRFVPGSLRRKLPRPCRPVHEIFPWFSVWGEAKRNGLRPLTRAEALQHLQREQFYVSSYAGSLPLRNRNGTTRCKKDVIKDFWSKKVCSVGVLGGKNIWRIYTRGRKPRIILKNDSFVTIVGPGARKFLNVINLKPSGLLANSTSADSATCFSQQIRAAWLTYRRTGAWLIRQFGAETPEGTACHKHLDDMSTTDAFQFIFCENMKALQSVSVPPNGWDPPEV